MKRCVSRPAAVLALTTLAACQGHGRMAQSLPGTSRAVAAQVRSSAAELFVGDTGSGLDLRVFGSARLAGSAAGAHPRDECGTSQHRSRFRRHDLRGQSIVDGASRRLRTGRTGIPEARARTRAPRRCLVARRRSAGLSVCGHTQARRQRLPPRRTRQRQTRRHDPRRAVHRGPRSGPRRKFVRRQLREWLDGVRDPRNGSDGDQKHVLHRPDEFERRCDCTDRNGVCCRRWSGSHRSHDFISPVASGENGCPFKRRRLYPEPSFHNPVGVAEFNGHLFVSDSSYGSVGAAIVVMDEKWRGHHAPLFVLTSSDLSDPRGVAIGP